MEKDIRRCEAHDVAGAKETPDTEWKMSQEKINSFDDQYYLEKSENSLKRNDSISTALQAEFMRYPSSPPPPPQPLKRPADQLWTDEYCWAWAFNGKDGQGDWGSDAHQAGVDQEREYLKLWMGTILTAADPRDEEGLERIETTEMVTGDREERQTNSSASFVDSLENARSLETSGPSRTHVLTLPSKSNSVSNVDSGFTTTPESPLEGHKLGNVRPQNLSVTSPVDLIVKDSPSSLQGPDRDEKSDVSNRDLYMSMSDDTGMFLSTSTILSDRMSGSFEALSETMSPGEGMYEAHEDDYDNEAFDTFYKDQPSFPLAGGSDMTGGGSDLTNLTHSGFHNMYDSEFPETRIFKNKSTNQIDVPQYSKSLTSSSVDDGSKEIVRRIGSKPTASSSGGSSSVDDVSQLPTETNEKSFRLNYRNGNARSKRYHSNPEYTKQTLKDLLPNLSTQRAAPDDDGLSTSVDDITFDPPPLSISCSDNEFFRSVSRLDTFSNREMGYDTFSSSVDNIQSLSAGKVRDFGKRRLYKMRTRGSSVDDASQHDSSDGDSVDPCIDETDEAASCHESDQQNKNIDGNDSDQCIVLKKVAKSDTEKIPTRKGSFSEDEMKLHAKGVEKVVYDNTCNLSEEKYISQCLLQPGVPVFHSASERPSGKTKKDFLATTEATEKEKALPKTSSSETSRASHGNAVKTEKSYLQIKTEKLHSSTKILETRKLRSTEKRVSSSVKILPKASNPPVDHQLSKNIDDTPQSDRNKIECHIFLPPGFTSSISVHGGNLAMQRSDASSNSKPQESLAQSNKTSQNFGEGISTKLFTEKSAKKVLEIQSVSKTHKEKCQPRQDILNYNALQTDDSSNQMLSLTQASIFLSNSKSPAGVHKLVSATRGYDEDYGLKQPLFVKQQHLIVPLLLDLGEHPTIVSNSALLVKVRRKRRLINVACERIEHEALAVPIATVNVIDKYTSDLISTDHSIESKEGLIFKDHQASKTHLRNIPNSTGASDNNASPQTGEKLDRYYVGPGEDKNPSMKKDVLLKTSHSFTDASKNEDLAEQPICNTNLSVTTGSSTPNDIVINEDTIPQHQQSALQDMEHSAAYLHTEKIQIISEVSKSSNIPYTYYDSIPSCAIEAPDWLVTCSEAIDCFDQPPHCDDHISNRPATPEAFLDSDVLPKSSCSLQEITRVLPSFSESFSEDTDIELGSESYTQRSFDYSVEGHEDDEVLHSLPCSLQNNTVSETSRVGKILSTSQSSCSKGYLETKGIPISSKTEKLRPDSKCLLVYLEAEGIGSKDEVHCLDENSLESLRKPHEDSFKSLEQDIEEISLGLDETLKMYDWFDCLCQGKTDEKSKMHTETENALKNYEPALIRVDGFESDSFQVQTQPLSNEVDVDQPVEETGEGEVNEEIATFWLGDRRTESYDWLATASESIEREKAAGFAIALKRPNSPEAMNDQFFKPIIEKNLQELGHPEAKQTQVIDNFNPDSDVDLADGIQSELLGNENIDWYEDGLGHLWKKHKSIDIQSKRETSNVQEDLEKSLENIPIGIYDTIQMYDWFDSLTEQNTKNFQGKSESDLEFFEPQIIKTNESEPQSSSIQAFQDSDPMQSDVETKECTNWHSVTMSNRRNVYLSDNKANIKEVKSQDMEPTIIAIDPNEVKISSHESIQERSAVCISKEESDKSLEGELKGIHIGLGETLQMYDWFDSLCDHEPPNKDGLAHKSECDDGTFAHNLISVHEIEVESCRPVNVLGELEAEQLHVADPAGTEQEDKNILAHENGPSGDVYLQSFVKTSLESVDAVSLHTPDASQPSVITDEISNDLVNRGDVFLDSFDSGLIRVYDWISTASDTVEQEQITSFASFCLERPCSPEAMDDAFIKPIIERNVNELGSPEPKHEIVLDFSTSFLPENDIEFGIFEKRDEDTTQQDLDGIRIGLHETLQMYDWFDSLYENEKEAGKEMIDNARLNNEIYESNEIKIDASQLEPMYIAIQADLQASEPKNNEENVTGDVRMMPRIESYCERDTLEESMKEVYESNEIKIDAPQQEPACVSIHTDFHESESNYNEEEEARETLMMTIVDDNFEPDVNDASTIEICEWINTISDSVEKEEVKDFSSASLERPRSPEAMDDDFIKPIIERNIQELGLPETQYKGTVDFFNSFSLEDDIEFGSEINDQSIDTSHVNWFDHESNELSEPELTEQKVFEKRDEDTTLQDLDGIRIGRHETLQMYNWFDSLYENKSEIGKELIGNTIFNDQVYESNEIEIDASHLDPVCISIQADLQESKHKDNEDIDKRETSKTPSVEANFEQDINDDCIIEVSEWLNTVSDSVEKEEVKDFSSASLERPSSPEAVDDDFIKPIIERNMIQLASLEPKHEINLAFSNSILPENYIEFGSDIQDQSFHTSKINSYDQDIHEHFELDTQKQKKSEKADLPESEPKDNEDNDKRETLMTPSVEANFEQDVNDDCTIEVYEWLNTVSDSVEKEEVKDFSSASLERPSSPEATDDDFIKPTIQRNVQEQGSPDAQRKRIVDFSKSFFLQNDIDFGSKLQDQSMDPTQFNWCDQESDEQLKSEITNQEVFEKTDEVTMQQDIDNIHIGLHETLQIYDWFDSLYEYEKGSEREAVDIKNFNREVYESNVIQIDASQLEPVCVSIQANSQKPVPKDNLESGTGETMMTQSVQTNLQNSASKVFAASLMSEAMDEKNVQYSSETNLLEENGTEERNIRAPEVLEQIKGVDSSPASIDRSVSPDAIDGDFIRPTIDQNLQELHLTHIKEEKTVDFPNSFSIENDIDFGSEIKGQSTNSPEINWCDHESDDLSELEQPTHKILGILEKTNDDELENDLNCTHISLHETIRIYDWFDSLYENAKKRCDGINDDTKSHEDAYQSTEIKIDQSQIEPIGISVEAGVQKRKAKDNSESEIREKRKPQDIQTSSVLDLKEKENDKVRECVVTASDPIEQHQMTDFFSAPLERPCSPEATDDEVFKPMVEKKLQESSLLQGKSQDCVDFHGSFSTENDIDFGGETQEPCIDTLYLSWFKSLSGNEVGSLLHERHSLGSQTTTSIECERQRNEANDEVDKESSHCDLKKDLKEVHIGLYEILQIYDWFDALNDQETLTKASEPGPKTYKPVSINVNKLEMESLQSTFVARKLSSENQVRGKSGSSQAVELKHADFRDSFALGNDVDFGTDLIEREKMMKVIDWLYSEYSTDNTKTCDPPCMDRSMPASSCSETLQLSSRTLASTTGLKLQAIENGTNAPCSEPNSGVYQKDGFHDMLGALGIVEEPPPHTESHLSQERHHPSTSSFGSADIKDQETIKFFEAFGVIPSSSFVEEMMPMSPTDLLIRPESPLSTADCFEHLKDMPDGQASKIHIFLPKFEDSFDLDAEVEFANADLLPESNRAESPETNIVYDYIIQPVEGTMLENYNGKVMARVSRVDDKKKEFHESGGYAVTDDTTATSLETQNLEEGMESGETQDAQARAAEDADYAERLAEVHSMMAKFSRRVSTDVDRCHLDVINAIDNLVEKMAFELQHGTLTSTEVMQGISNLKSMQHRRLSGSDCENQSTDRDDELSATKDGTFKCDKELSASPSSSLGGAEGVREKLEHEIYDILDDIMSLLGVVSNQKSVGMLESQSLEETQQVQEGDCEMYDYVEKASSKPAVAVPANTPLTEGSFDEDFPGHGFITDLGSTGEEKTEYEAYGKLKQENSCAQSFSKTEGGVQKDVDSQNLESEKGLLFRLETLYYLDKHGRRRISHDQNLLDEPEDRHLLRRHLEESENEERKEYDTSILTGGEQLKPFIQTLNEGLMPENRDIEGKVLEIQNEKKAEYDEAQRKEKLNADENKYKDEEVNKRGEDAEEEEQDDEEKGKYENKEKGGNDNKEDDKEEEEAEEKEYEEEKEEEEEEEEKGGGEEEKKVQGEKGGGEEEKKVQEEEDQKDKEIEHKQHRQPDMQEMLEEQEIQEPYQNIHKAEAENKKINVLEKNQDKIPTLHHELVSDQVKNKETGNEKQVHPKDFTSLSQDKIKLEKAHSVETEDIADKNVYAGVPGSNCLHSSSVSLTKEFAEETDFPQPNEEPLFPWDMSTSQEQMQMSFEEHLTDEVAENIVNRVLASQEQKCLQSNQQRRQAKIIAASPHALENDCRTRTESEGQHLPNVFALDKDESKSCAFVENSKGHHKREDHLSSFETIDLSKEFALDGVECENTATCTQTGIEPLHKEEDFEARSLNCSKENENVSRSMEEKGEHECRQRLIEKKPNCDNPSEKKDQFDGEDDESSDDDEEEEEETDEDDDDSDDDYDEDESYSSEGLDSDSEFVTSQHQERLCDEVASAMSQEIVLMAEVEVAMEDATNPKLSPVSPSVEKVGATAFEQYAMAGRELFVSEGTDLHTKQVETEQTQKRKTMSRSKMRRLQRKKLKQFFKDDGEPDAPKALDAPGQVEAGSSVKKKKKKKKKRKKKKNALEQEKEQELDKQKTSPVIVIQDMLPEKDEGPEEPEKIQIRTEKHLKGKDKEKAAKTSVKVQNRSSDDTLSKTQEKSLKRLQEQKPRIQELGGHTDKQRSVENSKTEKAKRPTWIFTSQNPLIKADEDIGGASCEIPERMGRQPKQEPNEHINGNKAQLLLPSGSSQRRSRSRSRSPAPPSLRRITGQSPRRKPRGNVLEIPKPN
ncbi:LOW QUALITY PROTEIN: hypothetical protein ElyMa_001339700 [Elysia marginata]|uniref:Uncharacterized protein n=1 Tax=Elysia marginata TaxID=1093978 RepID=A0AAV4IQY7_9GAST|nr:LOW QUALITY PROTEIN: hypothetical protein ElyMa_001339700 [Elysia marginata]